MAMDADTILNRFMNAEDVMTELHNDWLRFYELYRSYRNKDTNAFSNLFVPQTFISIEQVLPRIVSSIVRAEPTASIHPRKAGSVLSAKKMEQLFNYQLGRAEFKKALTPTIKTSLIYGTGVMKSQWKIDDVEIQGQMTDRYRGPDVEYVSPFDIFPDPHCSSKEDAEYIMHRYFVTKRRLMGWQEDDKVGNNAGGVDIREVDGMSKKMDSRSDSDFKQKKLRNIGKRSTSGRYTDEREWVRIVEYWDKFEDRVYMLANHDHIVRNEENPYFTNKVPFFFFRDYPIGDEFWGVGEVEAIEDLQEEINTQRNQRIDARSLSLNPILQVDPGAMVDNDEIVFEPGRIWNVQPGAVQAFALPDTGTASVEEEQIATQNIKDATAVTDVIRGQQGQNFPETATGVNKLDTNASTRFNMKVRNYEEPLQNMFEHMVMMNQQYIDKDRVVRVTGELPEEIQNQAEEREPYKFLNVNPQDVPNFYDYEIKGAKSVTQIQRQQRFIQLLQIGQQFASEFNTKQVLRRLFEAMEVKDIDRLLSVPEEQLERLERVASSQRQQASEMAGEAEGTREDNAGNQPREAGATPENANAETLGAVIGGQAGGAPGASAGPDLGPVRVEE